MDFLLEALTNWMKKRIIPISREFGRKRALRHRGALRRFYLSCKSSYPHFTAVLLLDIPKSLGTAH